MRHTKETSMQMTVVGGGSWGTALAHLMACKGIRVTMLLRREDQAREINTTRHNARYLPGISLSPSLSATTDARAALADAAICLLAVPCQTMRETLRHLAPLMRRETIQVCVSKGIDASTLSRMSEVVKAELPDHLDHYAILSGPSFAAEVAAGKPTAVSLGCRDKARGEYLRGVFSTPLFRVYSTTDVVGVETGGALKNIIAIAAGICDGLDLGHNARAALITRGLAELTRLGTALGAQPATFMGLSGMGDLVLTCTGDLSRNRQVGLRLGRGERLADILASMHNVAEGVKTTEAACALANSLGVDLPIAGAVNAVITGNTSPAAVVHELMTRTLKDE